MGEEIGARFEDFVRRNYDRVKNPFLAAREILDFFRMPTKQYNSVLRAVVAKHKNYGSWAEYVGDGNWIEEGGQILRIPGDVEGREEIVDKDELTREELVERVIELVETLEPRKKEIIYREFFSNENNSDIGKDWGVSRERVRQLKNKAFETLRHKAVEAGLRDYLPD